MKTHQPHYEMGLTHDDLYKKDVAMPYWLQFETKGFLQAVAHDLKRPGITINSYLKLIYDDPNIANLPVSATSNQMTVKDICDVILKATGHLNDITGVMWEYSQTLKKEPSDDTEQ